MKEQINPESWSPYPTFSTLTLLTTSFPPCFDFGIEGRLDPEEKGKSCLRCVTKIGFLRFKVKISGILIYSKPNFLILADVWAKSQGS